MIPLYRPFLFSITLHTVLILFFIRLGGDFLSRERPAVVDLTFVIPVITSTGTSHHAASIPERGKQTQEKQPYATRKRSSYSAGHVEPIKTTMPEITYPKGLSSNLQPEKILLNPISQPVRTPEAGSFSGKHSPTDTLPVGSTGNGSGKPRQSGSSFTDGAGSSGSGDKGIGGSGTVNFAEQLRRKYLNEHFAYIQNIIKKNLTYPRKALKEGWSGTVLLSFIILENGQVSNIRILKSSGHEILDTNVIDTIKTISPFPKPPLRAELHMQIPYQLEE